MNSKFFDLKKEKQDKMINGALKVFGIWGYQNASTDDIVKEAGISKGLLFHYFENKIGLYSFVYDYCTRFLDLELGSLYIDHEVDFFELCDLRLGALMKVAQTYPYLPLFLLKVREETVPAALEVLQTKGTSLRETIEKTDKRYASEKDSEAPDLQYGKNILFYTLRAILQQAYQENRFQPEMVLEEMREYLQVIQNKFR